ncbi:hypothetical protein D3C72_953810 [compost metagenome]
MLSNAGSLVRFFVNAPHTTPATTATVVRKETLSLPRNNTATHTELFRSAPVVIGGKAVIGSWRRTNSGASSLDMGTILYANTGVNYVPAATTTATGSVTTSIATSSPIWAPPAVEFDDNLNPVYAFVPTGYVVTIADLNTGDQIQSPPLLVHATTPQSGNLTAAPDAGVSSRTVTALTNACLTIGNTTAVPLVNTTTQWKDTVDVAAAETYDNTITEAVYGYMKFAISGADLDPSNTGSPRAILNAVLELRCNSASNTGAKKLRSFRVSNNTSTGGAWDNTISSPTIRPRFENGTAFSLATLNANKAYELVGLAQTGPTFSNNSKPSWSAKGLVTAAGTYSFGLALEDRGYVNTASNNGMPNRTSAPQFGGATSGNPPKLTLELSANGLATPTMTAPVTIDSANRRIYAVNTNALYVTSYASPTYDVTSNPYDAASFIERKATFSDQTKTYFALTQLGRVFGPTSGGQYIANLTAPLFTGSAIYVQDHYSNATATTNQTAITAFTPAAAGAFAAPTFSHAYNLTTAAVGGNADAQRGGTYMCYDFAGRLYASTYSNTANAGRLWVISQ